MNSSSQYAVNKQTTTLPIKMLAWIKRLLPLLIPGLFILFVWYSFPFVNRIQFDGDEGINLLKAMMLRDGYPLYDQIWSDQPPLLTYLLVGVFRIISAEVNTARFFILLLSAALLLGAFLFVRQVWGVLHALIGVTLIILLPLYLQLSVSVMVGLPSLVFAMLALAALPAWHLKRKKGWLVLSGLLMSASVLVKLFTGFLVPVIGLGLLLGEISYAKQNWKNITILRPLFWWSLTFLLFTGVVLLFSVSPGNFSQLVGSHLEAQEVLQGEVFTLNYHLRDSIPLLLLAIFGIFITFITRRWLGLYLVGWIASAYVLLSFHSPVWYHHQLLVTIPAALLGGAAVGEAFHYFRKSIPKRALITPQSGLALMVIFSFCLVLYDQIPDTLVGLRFNANEPGQSLHGSEVLEGAYEQVAKYAPETQWMVTNMPMLAFRFQKPVPPNLVVFSTKRFETGNLSETDVFQNILRYDPEQILLRAELPELKAYLAENYDLVYTRRNLDLYIRRDVTDKLESGS